MVNYKCYVTYLIKYLSLYLNTNDVEYLRIVIKVLFNHELIKQVFSTQSTALISKQLQIACLKTVLSRLIFFSAFINFFTSFILHIWLQTIRPRSIATNLVSYFIITQI